MKIQCPVCETAYNLPAERITKPVVRAACRRCGSTLVIHKDTGKVETTAPSPGPTPKASGKNTPTPTAIPPSLTVKVAGRAGRDYTAIIVLVSFLVLISAAGYYFVSNSGKGFFAKPGESVSREVKGPNRFKVSKAYLRQDKKLLAAVGKIDRLTLLDNEMLDWKGKEMARVTIRVKGSKGSKKLLVLLLKEQGQWRAISAGEEPKVAKARTQPARTKKKPSPKASASPPGKKTHKIRLPATTTNKLLADYVRANPDLIHLNIQGCRNITDISPLVSLSRLSILNMTGCSKIEDISPLTRISSLRELHLPPTTDEKLARVLTHLPQLEKLSLRHGHQITDLSPMAGLTNLDHLVMRYASEVVDINPLTGLTRLKVLDLTNSGVQDLNALAKLSNLEWLYLSDSKGVNDISPLKNLTNLSILALNDCKGVRDITALGNLTKLRILSLRGLEELSDISALSSLTQLRTLYLQKCKKISQKQINELKKSLPRCSIELRAVNVGRAL